MDLAISLGIWPLGLSTDDLRMIYGITVTPLGKILPGGTRG